VLEGQQAQLSKVKAEPARYEVPEDEQSEDINIVDDWDYEDDF
jgi:hypothetical protein